MSISDGTYQMSQDWLITLMQKDEGWPVIIIPCNEDTCPDEQKWEITNLTNGNVSIKNVKNGTYLGYKSDPQPDSDLFGTSNKCEWFLQSASKPNNFYITIPKNTESPNMILTLYYDPNSGSHPPLAAVVPLTHNDTQAWLFTKLH